MNTIQLETFVCSECGEEFEAACFVEFEEKKKKHKCKPANKRAMRTIELQQANDDQYLVDLTADRIAQHNFNKLVGQGVIV